MRDWELVCMNCGNFDSLESEHEPREMPCSAECGSQTPMLTTARVVAVLVRRVRMLETRGTGDFDYGPNGPFTHHLPTKTEVDAGIQLPNGRG